MEVYSSRQTDRMPRTDRDAALVLELFSTAPSSPSLRIDREIELRPVRDENGRAGYDERERADDWVGE